MSKNKYTCVLTKLTYIIVGVLTISTANNGTTNRYNISNTVRENLHGGGRKISPITAVERCHKESCSRIIQTVPLYEEVDVG